MRISSISGVQNIKSHEAIQTKRSVQTPNVAVSVPISNIYLGRDLVSFGARPFHETLKENYFQLPTGCFPDEFQIEAGKGLNEGKNVLVEAPTGTGKTAIAHYAATKNLKEGKTTFYTTPLKALSNQKLNEFRAVYGDENVGILTGDRRENAEAPIVIMTTEVYRNMALANEYGQKNPLMENLGTVIFDEFHYLGDPSRGPVWEEALMYTPKGVQTLELSATIGNPEDLKNWIGSLDNSNEVQLVSIPEEARHVPLTFDYITTKSYQKNEDWIQKQLARTGSIDYDGAREFSPKPDLSDFKTAVNQLQQEDKLPAIFFVFSRKFSRELLDYLGEENKSLTTTEEQAQIKEILDKRKSEKYIGSDLNEKALINGYAIHNAGIIPSQKELIEELFQKKLVKAVIATETLAAGINMPAKTVVISSPYKPTDENDSAEKMRILSANEFKQMAGRAGRRGIDTQGFVYTMPTDRNTEMDFLELESTQCNPLESKYNPDYAFLCGFYEHNGESQGLKDVFAKSFFAFGSDENESDTGVQKLMQDSMKRTDLLRKRGYLTEDNGLYSLTDKGLMASKVKGYNTIPLVDLIHSGKMADITPETLAMIAGAIANPSNTEDSEISVGMDFASLTSHTEKHIENVRAKLEKSVADKFKMLGKSPASFKSYEAMLDFAEGLSKPDVEEDVLRGELRDLSAKRTKIYLIQKTTGKMQPEELVKAIAEGKTVPTKILEDNLEIVERFKKRVNTRNIESHIQKLEHELGELSRETKGKKAQARIERKKKELQSELSNARAMKYLEANLYNAIGANHQFLKKNPPAQINSDFAEAQKQFVKLISKDALVGEIKGLIGLDDYIQTHDMQEEEENNRTQGSACLRDMMVNSAAVQTEEIKLDLPSKTHRLGRIGANAAYNWAMMNNANPSSMTNWRELIKMIPAEVVDEGCIYRGILQTADLLGQIGEIADAGMQMSVTEGDWEYYNQLKSKAAKARSLMIQEPVEV